MLSRRRFIRAAGLVGTAAWVWNGRGIEEVQAAARAVAGRSPDEVAHDEDYWRTIQSAFTVDRTIVNFNNGNHSPQPRVVQDAVKRYLDLENEAPGYYANLILSHVETVRRRLAEEFGCDPEEMAITRNASESLQIAQNGLDLQRGDEVITTQQDYPRMLTTWDQRRRRDGLTVTRLQFPVPTTAEDLLDRFRRAITPRTKVFQFCHITNLTGQLFPVRDLCRLAHEHGIFAIVDGAHAAGHFPYRLRDLECDAYGVSLHKWTMAPFGTGFLYVPKANIPKIWPLQAAGASSDDDVRKFEEVGTMPAAPKAAIAEALVFHQGIGIERKAARLRYLTLRWANALAGHPRVRMLSSLEPNQTWGLAMVGIEGLKAADIYNFLWNRARIVVMPAAQGPFPAQQFDFQAIRVTPNIYTTLEEVDTFVSAMQELLAR
ncbi:MAG TPA: aminotransferase class V-fold PLP-dependent enzyme [Vicinamibacterales bacterium]|nr:aminotransferase class V-fold PLP-dependent enzyme [Vicinamibacterales bacterium]